MGRKRNVPQGSQDDHPNMTSASTYREWLVANDYSEYAINASIERFFPGTIPPREKTEADRIWEENDRLINGV